MSFTRRYRAGTVNLTAPTIANKVFLEWLKDGVHQSYNQATSLAIAANTEMTAKYFSYSIPCSTPQSIATASGVITVTFNGTDQSVLDDSPVTSNWSVEFKFPDYVNVIGHYGYFVELANIPLADCSPAAIGSNNIAYSAHITAGSGMSAREANGGTSSPFASCAADPTSTYKLECVANVVKFYKDGVLQGTASSTHDGSNLYLLIGSYIGTQTDRVQIISFARS